CNRTYSGTTGKTYQLELHRPKEDKIPFICDLTFTAAGGVFGDLVQITFDSFTLGRFVSFTSEGCPDGALQISEFNRPQVGGAWCGTSWGPVMYYSEAQSVTLHVQLLKLSKVENGYNFDYRMGYKFLKRRAAIVRYGGSPPLEYSNLTLPTIAPEPEYYLGELISGTYCSRIFSDCDKKHCRLQSPNFPGVYPRNLTCYYAVRQHEIPPGEQTRPYHGAAAQGAAGVHPQRRGAARHGHAPAAARVGAMRPGPGLRGGLRRLHDARRRHPEVLRRRGGGAGSDVQRPRAAGGVLHVALRDVPAAGARPRAARLPAGGRGAVRRPAVAQLHQAEAHVRVLGARQQSRRPAEPAALPARQHHLPVPLAGERRVTRVTRHCWGAVSGHGGAQGDAGGEPAPHQRRLALGGHAHAAAPLPRLAVNCQVPRGRRPGGAAARADVPQLPERLGRAAVATQQLPGLVLQGEVQQGGLCVQRHLAAGGRSQGGAQRDAVGALLPGARAAQLRAPSGAQRVQLPAPLRPDRELSDVRRHAHAGAAAGRVHGAEAGELQGAVRVRRPAPRRRALWGGALLAPLRRAVRREPAEVQGAGRCLPVWARRLAQYQLRVPLRGARGRAHQGDAERGAHDEPALRHATEPRHRAAGVRRQRHGHLALLRGALGGRPAHPQGLSVRGGQGQAAALHLRVLLPRGGVALRRHQHERVRRLQLALLRGQLEGDPHARLRVGPAAQRAEWAADVPPPRPRGGGQLRVDVAHRPRLPHAQPHRRPHGAVQRADLSRACRVQGAHGGGLLRGMARVQWTTVPGRGGGGPAGQGAAAHRGGGVLRAGGGPLPSAVAGAGQKKGPAPRRAGHVHDQAQPLPISLSRAGRLHQRLGVVRRRPGLSLGRGRGLRPLLGAAAAASSLSVLRRRVPVRCLRRAGVSDVEAVQTPTPIDSADASAEPLLGHGHHRREGRDL
ncbi:hypothetical protein D910_04063, partial [Dendroctonus ponderosae]